MPPAKGYTEMKDSGIEWLGKIPNNWRTIRVKYAFRIKKEIAGELGHTVLSVTQRGIKPKDMSEKGQFSLDYSKYQLVSSGDFIMNHMDLLTGWVDISNMDGVTSPDYRVFQSSNPEKYYPDFYRYVFQTCYQQRIFYGLGQGVSGFGRWRLPAEIFLNFYLPVPPYESQSAIAAYLDTQCAKIDEIIAQAKASIEDYKQWKASIIYEAVTKGLDPNVEMKDSGIEWIGKMPKHWQDINPKALFSQRKERANPGDRQLTASQQFGVIYQDEYMEMTGTKVVTVEKDFDILKYVSAGDFVISMRSFQGGLEYSTKSGSISSAYVMLVPNLKLVYPRYYRWLLKSNGYIRALQSTSDLVRDGQAMRYSNFAKVRLITLPLGEQEQIANYLDTQCAKIDKLMTEKQSLIDDLESYKKSLIYEVVTGKRRVC